MATQYPVNLLDIQILLEEEHTADVAPHSTSVLPSAEEDDQTKLNRQSSTVLSIRSMLTKLYIFMPPPSTLQGHYPLPAMAFSEQECDYILNTFEKVILPQAGIICTADRTMVHIPETIGGLGIKSRYIH